MKKLMTLMLVILTTSIFATDWYSTKELMIDLKPMEFSKDTAWYGYGSAAWGWGLTEERATLFNVEDFGIEYPVTLHAISAYLLDNGNDYSYKIYDKDGTTVIFQTAESTAFDGYNDYYFSLDSLIIFDDFYMSVVPAAAGGPEAVTSDVVPESHSYWGGPGAWEPMLINDEIYELIHYVALSPFNGLDSFPPVVKEVIGAEAFMDMDIQLTMIAQDPNGVLSPVVGEYTLDGGTTWTLFNLTEAKSNYYFSGTIPAQVDGTVGAVRFNMSDTLANVGVSKEFEISWSKDNYILNESFESLTFPPDGWSLVTNGADWIHFARSAAFVNVRTGNYCASHNDDNVAAIETDWLISPPIDIPATNSCMLSFWQVGRYVDYLEGHEVAISIDGGTTWTQIYVDSLPDPDFGYELTEEIFSLKAYKGETVLIGWAYTGDYSDEWFIDDVTLEYDYLGPVPITIEGNPALLPSIGAFLNNDLDITITADDESGIDSIMAHYSYDSGTTWTDLPFSKLQKVTEKWIGTISAESVPITGIINFDMTDIGGNSSTTLDYDFFFVGDSDSADFAYVTGTEAFLNDPMNLTIGFTDESAIDSCSASYSKDGFVTQYDFELTPSKMHEYTYVGTIPAETEEVLDGEVRFIIIDAAGNSTTTANYTVQWRDGQFEFNEDFESGTDGWILTGNWGLEEGEYTSATHSLTESPGGNYVSDENTTAGLENYLDWSTYLAARMSFWCKYDIEPGFDYMYFDVTADSGETWTNLKIWSGEGVAWHEEKITLDHFVGTTGFNFRFRWESDGGYEVNGMYIDDIEITTYAHGITPPLIVFNHPPLFYEGVDWNYTNTVAALDIDGVAAVEVYYCVDGVAQPNVSATHIIGVDWEFTIPSQPAGSLIGFDFWAIDNEGFETEFYGYRYSMIAGEHLIYDSGIVSYYNTTENGDAKAVRITIPPIFDATYYLSTLLLRNYADIGGHFSDAMTVRVWQDDGTGQPGLEIITPIEVVPPANNLEDTSAMTLVDLRAIELSVWGDIWIGFSSDHGIVYSTQEDTGETGTTAYDRSYDGADNGDGTWTWTEYTGINYHFRAALELRYGISDNNIPVSTELLQNYPNPFNPETTINFTIADDAKVSLVVYDVMGRAVAKLVDGNLSKGSHKVSFDASSMVSGVYYYNLKAGDVNQTKKMMLIK